MENYKTAYALRRLKFIESIFSDDALIIVGREIKKSTTENPFKDDVIVVYNHYSKEKYIKKLAYSFKRKEYINIKFEDSQIKKANKDCAIYGIQIKQHYYSSNYGDVGYLFLMVNLEDVNKPIINVRTWQPNKDSNGEIFDIGHFNFSGCQ